jgi:riboflavin kinase / FMN adenylyltransferase
MKVIYGVNKIRKFPRPVVALGVFDGVHAGHREILKSAVKRAKEVRGTSVVVTFWPHPQKEQSLYSLEHRLNLISELAIDVCVVINFTRDFSGMAAGDFIANILVKRLGAAYVFIGRNFRFGKKAQGDFTTLLAASKVYGFKLRAFHVVKVAGMVVSSTAIRDLIKRGDLKTAQRLLMRPVSILGTVIKGISLGRALGFPTANIDPHHEIIPPAGVYGVRVVHKGKTFRGACYIGPKPVFFSRVTRTQGHKVTSNIEVHIFDFRKNIYGQSLEIQFVEKIREPKRFLSPSPLSFQIKKDVSFLKKKIPLP